MVQKHFCTTTYIFNAEGTKCLLVRHKKLPYNFPPGGHIDENEDYFESSQREVKEELGFSGEDITYPDFLHKRDGECVQPWTIQKYTIVPNEHYHYDLIFIGVVDENTPIIPGEGESDDYKWFDASDIDNVETTDECRSNVKKISQLLQQESERKKVQDNLYQWPRYDDTLKSDLSRFVEGRDFGTWNLGDLYDKVPCDFANKMGVEYGIFTSTGTAGLHASLMALGLKPGDEVIVPSMTFIRAVTPLIHLSLQPVIADIDKDTGNIDPVSIKANITPKTKAVVAVHMWGVPVDCEAIAKICKDNNLRLIEDFSHAHFSMYKNRYVGSFGDVAFASLQRKKNVSVGEGGIIVTNDKAVYERLQQITSPGSFVDGVDYANIDFSGYGLNMRISPFGAVVAKNLLPRIDDFVKDKQKTVEVLSNILAGHNDIFELPKLPNDATSTSWYSYKVKISGISMDDLKGLHLWKFSDFGYPAIANHPYWSKDKSFFPFSLGIKPETRLPLKGHDLYLENRVTLSLPTVSESYWTKEKIKDWDNALKELKRSK